MNNPSIEVGFPLSEDIQYITRASWRELSRSLEARYPAVHLWLYRLYRLPRLDKAGGESVCLRLGGIRAFSKVLGELLIPTTSTVIEVLLEPQYKIYLTLVPTLETTTTTEGYFAEFYRDPLKKLDPLVAKNLSSLLLHGNLSDVILEVYEGFHTIFITAIKLLRRETTPTMVPTKSSLQEAQDKLDETIKRFSENPIRFYIEAQEALEEYRRVGVKHRLKSEELRLKAQAQDSRLKTQDSRVSE